MDILELKNRLHFRLQRRETTSAHRHLIKNSLLCRLSVLTIGGVLFLFKGGVKLRHSYVLNINHLCSNKDCSEALYRLIIDVFQV